MELKLSPMPINILLFGVKQLKKRGKLDQKASDLYDEMIQAGVDTSIKAEEGLSTRRLQQLTTDFDAIFMRMKEGSMRNGQLKLGYNLQITTNNQYVLNYKVFPNPTDTRTFILFLKSTAVLNDFSYVVADAGYGSESNYSVLIDNLEKTPLIPYGMMLKEEKKKFKNDPTKSANGDYNATENFYFDYQGGYFSFKNYSILINMVLSVSSKSMKLIETSQRLN